MVEPGGQTPQPSSIPAPELASGEKEFLRLAGVPLRRLSSVQSLVRHPHTNAVAEFQSRLSIGPATQVDVLVTSHRIVFGNTTYVPANITSVTYHDHVKQLGCAYMSLGCGGLLLLYTLCPVTMILTALSGMAGGYGGGSAGKSWAIGLVTALAVIGFGIYLYKAATEQFSVTISTSGGGMDGFISRDRQAIQALHEAVRRSATAGE